MPGFSIVGPLQPCQTALPREPSSGRRHRPSPPPAEQLATTVNYMRFNPGIHFSSINSN
jgi:hypothetical protein